MPEDLAAEQAYLAELRAQREAEERQAAAARRAQLSAQGLLDEALNLAVGEVPATLRPDPLVPAANTAGQPALPPAAPLQAGGMGISPALLASLSPEVLTLHQFRISPTEFYPRRGPS